MPLAIPQETNSHGLPQSYQEPSSAAEFNEWLQGNRLFADGFVKKNMDQALRDTGSELRAYIARTYVKYPDQMKPAEERNENLLSISGDETPHLYNHMDRNGDNPAGISQQDAERIAKQLERFNFATQVLVTRRSQLPPGLSDAEEAAIMGSSSGVNDIEAIVNGTGEPPPTSPFILYRKGKEVDLNAVEPGNYAHVSYDDIIQMTIPELCDLIAGYKAQIEALLPNDIYVRSRIGAMEAIATYEMDAPETAGNYALFRYDAPLEHASTVAQSINRMLGHMSDTEFMEMQSSRSPTSQAFAAIWKGAAEVAENAAVSLKHEQARSLCPEEGALLGKLTRWIRSGNLPSNHLIRPEIQESTTGQRILGFDLTRLNAKDYETAKEKILELYEELGVSRAELDQRCIPDGLVLQAPSGTNRYEELSDGMDNINRGRPR